jgi:hypothetical protein
MIELKTIIALIGFPILVLTVISTLSFVPNIPAFDVFTMLIAGEAILLLCFIEFYFICRDQLG